MLGTTYPDETGGRLPPGDGVELLAEVTPALAAADIAFGNLEGPLIDGGVSEKCERMAAAKAAAANQGKKPKKGKKAKKAKLKKGTCWAFRVPTRYGQHLKDAGFDVMSLANNHAFDFGEEGRESSMKTLDALGIVYSGPIGKVAHLTANGLKVDVIAFATSPVSHDLNDLDAAKALVAQSVATADIVVISFHGGAEGAGRGHVPNGMEKLYDEKRGDLRLFTHAMVDAGADLVLGHGPHVVRGMEIYNGRLIAYSLGNFATYGGMNLKGPLGITLILEARIGTDGAFLDGRVIPVRQSSPGGPRLDKKKEVIPLLKKLSKEDFGATAIRVADDGTLSAPASDSLAGSRAGD